MAAKRRQDDSLSILGEEVVEDVVAPVRSDTGDRPRRRRKTTQVQEQPLPAPTGRVVDAVSTQQAPGRSAGSDPRPVDADGSVGVPTRAAARVLPRSESSDVDVDDHDDRPLDAKIPYWIRTAPGPDLADSVSTTEAIRMLGQCYVGKRRPVPVRRPGKTWVAEDRDLTRDDFMAHLGGTALLGGYLLDENDHTGVIVGDVDTDGPLRDKMLAGDVESTLRMAHIGLAVGSMLSFVMCQGVTVTLTGGKGLHCIAALPGRVPAAPYRRLFKWGVAQVLGLTPHKGSWRTAAGDWHLECYPRQDTAGDGLGNLIRLPFGVDPGTGRRSRLILGYGEDEVSPDLLTTGTVVTSFIYLRNWWQEVTRDRSWGSMAMALAAVPGVDLLVGGAEKILGAEPSWITPVAGALAIAQCYGAPPALGLMTDLEEIAVGTPA